MQLGLPFSSVFAALLVSLLVADNAEAAPYRRGPVPGSITLPLRRVAQRSDLPPLVLLQQHINRGVKRHARMTAREVPSDEELRARLHKRMYIPATGPGSHQQSKEKRFDRQGVPVSIKAGVDTNSLAKTTNNETTTEGESSDSTSASNLGPTAEEIVNAIMEDITASADSSKNSTNSEATAEETKATATGETKATATGETKATATAKAAESGSATQANSTAAETVTASESGAASETTSAAESAGTGFSEESLNAALQGDLTNAEPPAVADTLGLNIEANDVGYLADVQIGSENLTFPILMDSGSADFWVGAENCQLAVQQGQRRDLTNLLKRDPQREDGNRGGGRNGNGNNGGNGNGNGNGNQAGGGTAATNTCGANHVFLGSGTSQTFEDSGAPFQVTYGSGAVAGTIVRDDVSFAGLSLPGHIFGVATQETEQFADPSVEFSGLMGLAQSTLSNQQTLTPVESLAQSGAIPAAITSYKLGRVADGVNDGQVTFGSLDTSKFDQNTLVTIDNVSQQGFWQGAMDAVTVDGQDLGLQGRTAILDTGTTLMIVPEADANAIHAAIPGAQSDGQGGFTMPCTTTASLALSFGGTSFAIDPRDLLFVPVDATDLTGDCVSGITSGQIGGATEWLVGDVFLKNVYFSTNVNDNSMSLASLV